FHDVLEIVRCFGRDQGHFRGLSFKSWSWSLSEGRAR
ncbi:hypothetical protein A2U01_0086335, partial [Trifolium medium]|nr:hypothetical protein [Trifolium medium]